MDLRECYSDARGSYEDVMRRFMTEERVERFLKMFLSDNNYELLCCSMENQNYQEAYRAVHTMKGICLNLGLDLLSEACVALSENLRSHTPDENTEKYFEDLRVTYLKTFKALQSYVK